MGKAYPVLTSETSVQDPQTVCMHLQSSDFAQVYNACFTVLTALPIASARAELADFCHSKFPLRHKPLISQVHLAVCFKAFGKNPQNTWHKFLYLKLNQTQNLYMKCLKLLELLPLCRQRKTDVDRGS